MTQDTTLTSAKDLRRRRPPNRERVDTIKRGVELDLTLHQIRERRGVTQLQVAEQLATSRPNVSRIERETDVRLSTLQRYVEALGGELEVIAHFPDGEPERLIGPHHADESRPVRPVDDVALIGRIVKGSQCDALSDSEPVNAVFDHEHVDVAIVSRDKRKVESIFGLALSHKPKPVDDFNAVDVALTGRVITSVECKSPVASSCVHDLLEDNLVDVVLISRGEHRAGAIFGLALANKEDLDASLPGTAFTYSPSVSSMQSKRGSVRASKKRGS